MEMGIKALEAATSREQFSSILSVFNLRQLKEVAKHFDVHIGSATKSILRQRIEDAVIGAKLRSDAVRKTSLQ